MELTWEEMAELMANCDSFYAALDGARAARDGLLKAGLVAVEAVEAVIAKEEKYEPQV